MSNRSIIALAGAGGDLGGRIAKALVARGAMVRALVRTDIQPEERARIETLGAFLTPADPNNVTAMAAACQGAVCVVSALNGVREVIIGRQGDLLDAAVKANVPRFIPSDYSADFTKTRPGDNRNFDLRREFMALADLAPIKVTSILNGSFMDMLGREMPIIQPRIRRVLYWHDADQLLDFTTKDDVAAYVAAAAMDETTPRILRITADSVSARDIADAMTSATGNRYRPLWAGSIGHARRHDSNRQDRRAAAGRRVPAVAGDAVYARPVQRPRQALPPRQRPLSRSDMDFGSQTDDRVSAMTAENTVWSDLRPTRLRQSGQSSP